MKKTWLYLQALMLIFCGNAQAETPSVVRVGVLSYGTVNWELDTLKYHQLDIKRDIRVEPVKLTSKNAAAIALQSGKVDVILTDIFWVIKQAGAYQLSPTHKLTGGIYVRSSFNGNSPLSDVIRLGVAGGPNDKNLLLLKAYASAENLSLPEDIKYAAPPLLNEMLLADNIEGAINFWHYNARLAARGFKNVLSTETMLSSLGLDQDMPLLGWVFSNEFEQTNTQSLKAFLSASAEAKHLLVTHPEEWERLRPKMKVNSEQEYLSLIEHYPKTLLLTADMEQAHKHERAAETLFKLVKTLPQQTLFYQDAEFPESVFYFPDTNRIFTLSQARE